MDRGNDLHLVSGVVRYAGKNNRPFDFAGDQNRIALGAAKGRLFRRDLDSIPSLEEFKSTEIIGLRDLQVKRSRIGLYVEFTGKLVFHPGDLGEVCRNPDAVDDSSSYFNRGFLSFSRRFSAFYFPSD